MRACRPIYQSSWQMGPSTYTACSQPIRERWMAPEVYIDKPDANFTVYWALVWCFISRESALVAVTGRCGVQDASWQLQRLIRFPGSGISFLKGFLHLQRFVFLGNWGGRRTQILIFVRLVLVSLRKHDYLDRVLLPRMQLLHRQANPQFSSWNQSWCPERDIIGSGGVVTKNHPRQPVWMIFQQRFHQPKRMASGVCNLFLSIYIFSALAQVRESEEQCSKASLVPVCIVYTLPPLF